MISGPGYNCGRYCYRNPRGGLDDQGEGEREGGPEVIAKRRCQGPAVVFKTYIYIYIYLYC